MIYETCGCILRAGRSRRTRRTLRFCGSADLANRRYCEAVRGANEYRRRLVALALSYGGPQDGLAREADAYGIVPMRRETPR